MFMIQDEIFTSVLLPKRISKHLYMTIVHVFNWCPSRNIDLFETERHLAVDKFVWFFSRFIIKTCS